MIIIDNTLVSDDVVREHFLCNLEACKGACCWEGDAGAPLEEHELPVMAAIFDKVVPFLSPAGVKAISEQGVVVLDDEDQIYRTPLIDNGPCAYMTYDASGKAQCGIEKAWQAGVVDFQKPISCHLYPIRIEKHEKTGYEALNYERWDICSAACTLGEKEQLPVYQFLKGAIIRKYGEAYFEELEEAAKHFNKDN